MTDPVVTDRDVYITRSFAAPRAVVWKFWTQPERIAEWFGPTGFTVPLETVTIELRVGGSWNLAMQDDTGARFPITGEIVELVDEELLVVRLGAATGMGDIDDVLLRVQLHDHGELTRLTLHQGPFTDEQRSATAEGWELSFVKLDRIFLGGDA